MRFAKRSRAARGWRRRKSARSTRGHRQIGRTRLHSKYSGSRYVYCRAAETGALDSVYASRSMKRRDSITPVTFSREELREIRRMLLEKLARALGCDPGYLIVKKE